MEGWSAFSVLSVVLQAYKPPEDEDLAVLEATTPLPGAESEEDISSALQHLEYSSDEDGVKSTGKSRKSRKRPQSAKVEEEEEESDFTTLDRAGATAEEEDVRKALSLFRKYGATPLSHPIESPTYLCEAYGWTFSQPFIAALSDAASGLSRPVEDMEDICGTLLGIALAQIGCPRTGKVGSHISELVSLILLHYEVRADYNAGTRYLKWTPCFRPIQTIERTLSLQKLR